MLNDIPQTLPKSRLKVNILTAAISTAMVAATVIPAQAQAAPNEVVEVRIPAVTLESSEGIADAYVILQDKAEEACFQRQVISLNDQRFAGICADDLLEDFVLNTGSAALADYHATMKNL